MLEQYVAIGMVFPDTKNTVIQRPPAKWNRSRFRPIPFQIICSACCDFFDGDMVLFRRDRIVVQPQFFQARAGFSRLARGLLSFDRHLDAELLVAGRDSTQNASTLWCRSSSIFASAPRRASG